MKENAFTDYKRNEKLYSRLLDFAGDDKLPVLDNNTFESMNAEYGKVAMRKNLADYIATERPVFPLIEISENTMRDTFERLRKFDTSTICISKEQVEKEVLEKYDDYEYPYSRYGLGLINGSSNFNKVSNYFMQDLRLECSSYGHRAPKEVWENGDAYAIWKCLGPIWRGINDVKLLKVTQADGTVTEELKGGSLTASCIVEAFRLGTYVATQFKPVVAKAIYQMTNAKTVLDTSCGWGDRLAGFFASDAEEYYGCDPNPNTYARYTQQISKYNKGGEFQEDQSWSKFDEYEKWRDDFYLPVAEKSMAVSKFLFVNIMDPNIKGTRYRSSDELVNRLKDKFLGQIGMRIMQRPKSDKLFADEKEKNEFRERMFIENVWCFGPKTDLFKDSRKANLDDFFA